LPGRRHSTPTRPARFLSSNGGTLTGCPSEGEFDDTIMKLCR
jgi:hypothetical protein